MPLMSIHLTGEKTIDQKRNLVKDATDAIHNHLGILREHVFINIVEYKPQNYALAGKLVADVTNSQVVITLKLFLKGVAMEQRRELVKDVTESAIKHFGVSREDIMVEMVDNLPENVSVGGILISDSKSEIIR